MVYAIDAAVSMAPNFLLNTQEGVKNGMFNIGDLIEMPFNVEYNCRFATIDGLATLLVYVAGYDYVVDYTDTFAYNFGLIYDSIWALVESY